MMSTKLKQVEKDGLSWLVVGLENGRRIWLHPQCKSGDRRQPGQKMKEDGR
jgi:hypothetical protein